MDYYTITEAAQILGVSVKTLKRWDRNEILVAQRTVTNRRLYTDKQIKEALGEKEKYEDANEILYHVTEAYRRLAKNEEKVTYYLNGNNCRFVLRVRFCRMRRRGQRWRRR